MNGGEVAEQTKALREIEAQILKHDTEHREALQQAVNERQSDLFYAKSKAGDIQNEINKTKESYHQTKHQITAIEVSLDALRAQWNNEYNNAFEFDSICPTCGQQIPESKLEEAKAMFNQEKAANLRAINDKGIAIKASMDEMRESVQKLESDLTKQENEHKKSSESILTIETELNEMKELQPQPPDDLLAAKKRIEESVAKLAGAVDTTELEAGIAEFAIGYRGTKRSSCGA
jgi:DNA repair exonuclease SbcCD ATPase subunit